ncbi:permease prefix domain 1-containing protein [Evansella clarkii]|uniref:permease prefix domain 1-containing protein n=1 Tax=Evansella clarkii TaxID=79879 RepID=UPI000997DDB5|nr:permease prefix domain 1-containing protein [Evansella clarkii]
MSKVDQYIESVLDHVELNQENKRDIKEEFTFHLNKKTEVYEEEGLSKQQAEETAISDFGVSSQIGKELNREIFPFRKPLLMIAGLTGVLFSALVTFSTYMFQEIVPLVWLILTLISNVSIFYFVQKPARAAASRLLLISLLLVTFLFGFYGYLLMDGFIQNQLVYYGLFALFLIHSAILFSQIYMGSMFQPVNVDLKMLSDEKRRSALLINILTGIIVLGVALFGLVGYIIFVPTSVPVIPLSLILAWFSLFLCHLKIRKLENLSRFLMIALASLVLAGFMYIQFAAF